MAAEFVKYEASDGVALITIDRPKALNALNPQVLSEVKQAFEKAEQDDEVRCVVLTGGGKAFVAGADIAEMAKMNAMQGRAFSIKGQAILSYIENLDKPVIAAVNGFALGGGCEIAMACDFIYASEKAKFGQPEINLGIVPGFGGTQRLTRRVGPGWAMELCLTGAVISAAEAKEIGLVNRVFAPEELMDKVMETAKLMAVKGRAALRSAKMLINNGQDMDQAKAIALEAEHFAVNFSSGDQQEGMNAFLEKRAPVFKGIA